MGVVQKDAEAGNRAFQKWVQHTEQLKANHEAEVKFISVVMALQGRLQGLEERLEAENVPLEEKQALVTKHQEVLEELDRETAKEEARHVAHEQSLVELTVCHRGVRGCPLGRRPFFCFVFTQDGLRSSANSVNRRRLTLN